MSHDPYSRLVALAEESGASDDTLSVFRTAQQSRRSRLNGLETAQLAREQRVACSAAPSCGCSRHASGRVLLKLASLAASAVGFGLIWSQLRDISRRLPPPQ